jgi:CDP-diacylglycerol pyrophosphatase
MRLSSGSFQRLRLIVPVLLLAFFGSAPVSAAGQRSAHHHHNPNALWHIVHDRCVPAARQGRMVKPCVQVSLEHGVRKGYVVIKDLRGVAQYLVIPTARISGIESPQLLQPSTPNYLADAWRARHWVEKKLGRTLARGDIALAINSIQGRSQNQLHIHVDCIRTDVRHALDRMLPAIGDTWAPLPQRLAGHPYRAMRLFGEQLHANPIKLLARSLRPGQSMGKQTVVVVGQRFADGRDGFLLLADHSDRATNDWGGGEELQDHQCHIAGVPASAASVAAQSH